MPSGRATPARAGTVAVAALAALLVVSGPAGAQQEWAAFRTPAPGPARPIGGHANGCLAGAVALPPEGTGYRVVRPFRERHWGHPDTVDLVRDLGRQVAREGLGTLLVGDMAQARGGPMGWGHVSHQTGLDVDLWFRLDLPPLPRAAREGPDLPSMVDPVTRRVDPSRWSGAQDRLVRLAAADARVARVFVHPAIKSALCASADRERGWLRKVRPWFGHEAHLHVRLACPADAPDCIDQEPPPAGDGCGQELATWLAPAPTRVPAPASRPAQRPPAPTACSALSKIP